MGIYDNALAGASGNQVTGYNLTKSLRLRRSATAYLSKTYGTSPTSRTTMTYSAWVKRGALGATMSLFGTGNNYESAYFNSSDQLYVGGPYMSAQQGSLTTTQVFRDPSAWYHIVIVFDTTNATAGNRLKLYVNGTQVTNFSSSTNSNQNNTTTEWLVSGALSTLGTTGASGSGNPFDGYKTEEIVVDGQALTPSSFGENNATTGVWQPIRYTGTYGTNGFYLPFTNTASTSTLGNDFSGNGNTWTVNNVSLTAGATYDSMTDVPTLTSATVANYCVLNPLDKGTNATIDNGNLRVYSSSGWTSNRGTMTYPSTGKYYFEWVYTSNTPAAMVGIATYQANKNAQLGSDAFGWGYHYSGDKYNNNTATAYGASYTTGDVIGVALDMTAGTLTFYKNNTSQGTAFSGLTGVYFPVSAVAGATAAEGPTINFGQQPFVYTLPSGFVALNTYNLPDSTIVAGNKVMDATTYTGTSAAQNIVNAGGFKPDLVWTKSRSDITYNGLTDSVRGVSKALFSNATDAESSSANNYVTAFNSNGFGVNQGSVSGYTGYTYVGWQWQAGQGTTSSNTSGSITSTVSVNASAGFSIVSYTGTGSAGTVGHGLGVAPKMIIMKNRVNTSAYWPVYHASAFVSSADCNILYLNRTDAQADDTNVLGNPATINSTVFSVDSYAGSNGSGNGIVAYCWSEIAGFSKFGSYTGNGSADGPFIYTGFRPKFVLIKRTDVAQSWQITDSSRDTYNVATNALFPNTSAVEGTGYLFDLVSNGFKIKEAGNNVNASGGTYIYACFAENPFKNALAR